MFVKYSLSILLSLVASTFLSLEATVPCRAVYVLGGTPKLNSKAKAFRKVDPAVWANLRAAIKANLIDIVSQGFTPSVDLRKFFGADFKPGRVDLLVQGIELDSDGVFLVKGAIQVEDRGTVRTFERLRVTYGYDRATKAVRILSFEISDYNPSLMIVGKKSAAWVEGKIKELVDASRNPDDEEYPQILVERFNPRTFSPQNARAALEVGRGMPDFRLEWIESWGPSFAADSQLTYETLTTAEGISALEGLANELQSESGIKILQVARELQEAGHLFKVYVRETEQVSWTASTRLAHFYIVWKRSDGELVGKVVKLSMRAED